MRDRIRSMGNRGMSLIELIIGMAIVSICVGSIAVGLNYVSSGNSKKAIIRMDTALSEVRLMDMSRSEKNYLYLAKNGEQVLMRVTTDSAITSIGSPSDWESVLEHGWKIQAKINTGTGTEAPELGDAALPVLRLSFSRHTGELDGIFFNGTDNCLVEEIRMVDDIGNGPGIIIVPKTGKHYVEMN